MTPTIPAGWPPDAVGALHFGFVSLVTGLAEKGGILPGIQVGQMLGDGLGQIIQRRPDDRFSGQS
jgi:hypothetical protein